MTDKQPQHGRLLHVYFLGQIQQKGTEPWDRPLFTRGRNLYISIVISNSYHYIWLQYHLPLVVVPGSVPTVLGRNWLEVIKLRWNRIHQLKAVNATPSVEDIIERYPNISKDEVSELRNSTASLRVDPNTKPIFCKARHEPCV